MYGWYVYLHLVDVDLVNDGTCYVNIKYMDDMVMVSNMFYFHPEPWGNDPI